MGHARAQNAAPKSGAQQDTTRLKVLGLVAACLLALPAYADEVTEATSVPPDGGTARQRAQFPDQTAPDAVRHMADWVVNSGDNGIRSFVIVDKPDAKVFVFDRNGKVLGSAWALVGLSKGDDSIPGIGTMPLTAITPDMRTTPAGRFVAGLGHDLGKLDVLWVDWPRVARKER